MIMAHAWLWWFAGDTDEESSENYGSPESSKATGTKPKESAPSSKWSSEASPNAAGSQEAQNGRAPSTVGVFVGQRQSLRKSATFDVPNRKIAFVSIAFTNLKFESYSASAKGFQNQFALRPVSAYLVSPKRSAASSMRW